MVTLNEGRPYESSGTVITIKPSVIVYKIAKLDDKENTITLNFLLSIVWNDPRISLESNNPHYGWYEIKEIGKSNF